MRRNNKLMYRYYNYSLIKIIEKTEKYFNKIENEYKKLNIIIITFDINNRDEYYNYLKDTLQDIKEKMNTDGIDGINTDFNTNIDTDNINQNVIQEKTNDQLIVLEKPIQRTETKEKEDNEKEEDLPTSLTKLKKLFKKIILEKNN